MLLVVVDDTLLVVVVSGQWDQSSHWDLVEASFVDQVGLHVDSQLFVDTVKLERYSQHKDHSDSSFATRAFD